MPDPWEDDGEDPQSRDPWDIPDVESSSAGEISDDDQHNEYEPSVAYATGKFVSLLLSLYWKSSMGKERL